MIDDEDDDEILKKGITLKSVFKNIMIILLMVIGAIFLYMGIAPDQTINIFIGFVFICLGATLIQIQKPEREPVRQTLTILKCDICGITKVRHYEEGDFVFDKKGRLVVYKGFGQTLYQSPLKWRIKSGSAISEVCNPCRTNDCACGVNFATLHWIRKEYKEYKVVIRECYIEPWDLVGIVVRFNRNITFRIRFSALTGIRFGLVGNNTDAD